MRVPKSRKVEKLGVANAAARVTRERRKQKQKRNKLAKEDDAGIDPMDIPLPVLRGWPLSSKKQ